MAYLCSYNNLGTPSDKDSVYIATFHSHASSLAAWKHARVNAANCNKDKELVSQITSSMFYSINGASR